jgi:hypothetical protein
VTTTSSTDDQAPAVRARAAVLELLDEHGIRAASDAETFTPAPVGVLVGLPALTGRGLASWAFTVPVFVVSGDPVTNARVLGRLYALADDAALALRVAGYAPTSFTAGTTAEPLTALELEAVVTVSHNPGG